MPPSPEPRQDPELGVTAAIRRDIVSGALRPGTRLPEVSLAQRFGTSRVPVREALRALEVEGFVLSRPHAGARVADIPVDDADDLFAVREALETATARRAALTAASLFTADEDPTAWWRTRRELAAILDEGDAAVARGDLAVLVDLNDRFHLGVAELSGSPSLGGLLRQLSRKIEWLYAADEQSRGKKLWPEHRQILSAIDSGDAPRAAELMAWHVRQSRIGYRTRLSTSAATPTGVVATEIEPTGGRPATAAATGVTTTGAATAEAAAT